MDGLTDGGTDGTGRMTRRRLVRTGAIAATAGLLAGCIGDGGDGGDGSDGSDGGADQTDGTASTSSGETPEATETQAATPIGADILGGPDDLQSSAEVRATVLEEDQGAGRYVFTPAVVWLEPGGTVYWTFEETDHTVTVYHPQYDKPNRIPQDVETPFNSEFTGGGEPGTGFNFVFDVEGIWNYFCKPHEDRGMVGMVIVGEPQGGDGAVPPTDVESAAASEKLARLLDSTDVAETNRTDSDGDVVEIPRYEFSVGESYTFETLLRTSDGTTETTETWAVTSVEGDDVTVEVTSEADGETTTKTLSGTHETIYDAAARKLTFNFFSVARSPLRIAEIGELSAGNNFTVQRSQFPNQDTINWSTATVEVAGETTVNGVTCTEFTLRPADVDQVQTACVADDYPFAVSLQAEQAGTTTMELTLTDSTRP
jgi:plastocyanin